MKGLIMIGYQGIGKSSCAGKNNCIDLESGSFWIDGLRLKIIKRHYGIKNGW